MVFGQYNTLSVEHFSIKVNRASFKNFLRKKMYRKELFLGE